PLRDRQHDPDRRARPPRRDRDHEARRRHGLVRSLAIHPRGDARGRARRGGRDGGRTRRRRTRHERDGQLHRDPPALIRTDLRLAARGERFRPRPRRRRWWGHALGAGPPGQMRLRRALTQATSGCDDAPRMGTPRQPARGGGVWRMRAARATTVALVVGAFLGSLAQPASADDPITAALKRKEELERAVQISRANAERYQAVANQFQAVVSQTNARISDLADKQANAQSEADQLFYQIQIAEEQLALVTFQLDETKALTDSLKAEAAEETKQLATREDLYARHLRTTYRQALVSPLEMLLSSASLTEFANRLQAMIFINRQDVQLANEIRNLRADTQDKQDQASSKEKEILGLADQITTQRTQLATAKTKYDKLVADAQTAIDAEATSRQVAAQQRQAAQGRDSQTK